MLNLDNIIDIPHEKVSRLNEIIQQKRYELQKANLYINNIVREDIFNILDYYCTVVFYPLDENESNDGFHITMPVDYKDNAEEHFVFLNTTKPLEKQVFAAAHELGHIWVDEEHFWNDGLEQKLSHNPANIEAVMNRFAAELLMPKDLFFRSAKQQLKHFITEDRKIYIIDVFRVITSLMDEFCVPAQAVIYRFYEVNLLKKETCQKLLIGSNSGIQTEGYQNFFDDIIKKCVQEGGYTKLLNSSDKRGIKDFPEILRKVEQEELFPAQKIEKLRNMLSIPPITAQDAKIDIVNTD